MLLNHNQDAEYALQPWRYAAAPGQVLVLHTLCVLPGHSRRGIGRKMVQFAQDLARSRGCTVMRFDTNIDNIPASHLYENMGFELVSTGKAMLNGILPVTLRYYEKNWIKRNLSWLWMVSLCLCIAVVAAGPAEAPHISRLLHQLSLPRTRPENGTMTDWESPFRFPPVFP